METSKIISVHVRRFRYLKIFRGRVMAELLTLSFSLENGSKVIDGKFVVPSRGLMGLDEGVSCRRARVLFKIVVNYGSGDIAIYSEN